MQSTLACVHSRNTQVQGFSLIELLVAVALFSVVVLGISSLNLHLRNQLRDSAALGKISVVSRNIKTLILDTSSWKNTVAQGSTGGALPASLMNCLKNGTPCTIDGTAGGVPIQLRKFAIYDGGNQLYFDATNDQNGLTASGMECASFSSQSDSKSNCNFRFDLRWSANCVPGNCVNPQVKISAKLMVGGFDVGQKIVVNTVNYSLDEIFRSAQ
jgi:prepilin-type N-terminal cleavage/methylation domain-containing protein